MTIIQRSYKDTVDFDTVSRFLTQHYEPGNRDGNWFQPIWEYAVFHSCFDVSAQDRIGIWEDGDIVVGVAMYEMRLGEAFFQTHPSYAHLKPEMLTYAEQNLAGTGDDGKRSLKAFGTILIRHSRRLLYHAGTAKSSRRTGPCRCSRSHLHLLRYTFPMAFASRIWLRITICARSIVFYIAASTIPGNHPRRGSKAARRDNQRRVSREYPALRQTGRDRCICRVGPGILSLARVQAAVHTELLAQALR